jgi:GTP-binding protein
MFDVVRAEFHAAASRPDQLPPPTLVEVAFAGRSNVGKSSVMNSLLQRRGLVRTSSTPGCTRQIALFQAELRSGGRLMLVDLPGYGYARRARTERIAWAELAERYLLERPTLRAVCLVVDVRRGLEADDQDLLEMLSDRSAARRPDVSAILVATKLDKLAVSARKPTLDKLRSACRRPFIGFSAVDGTGRAELWRKILTSAELGSPTESAEPRPA